LRNARQNGTAANSELAQSLDAPRGLPAAPRSVPAVSSKAPKPVLYVGRTWGLLEAELLPDQSQKALFDLVVTRNRRFLSVRRVDVDIVPTAVAMKLAVCFREFPYELTTAQALDRNLGRLNRCSHRSVFVFYHQVVRVSNVLFQLLERFALTEDARDFAQPPNVPAVIEPVLQRKVPHDLLLWRGLGAFVQLGTRARPCRARRKRVARQGRRHKAPLE